MVGVCSVLASCSPLFISLESEYTWSRKAQGAREVELDWRVKENIVDTTISFIWYHQCHRFHYELLTSDP